MTERSSDSHPPEPQDIALELSRPSLPDDFDVLHSERPPSPASPHRPRFFVLVAVVVLVGAAIWFVVSRPTPEPSAPTAETAVDTPATTSSPGPLGGVAADTTVPPLDESDNVVRQLVQRLTSHPIIGSWLATTGLIRNFTVVIANIADGTTPARHLRALRPAAPFATVSTGGRTVIDTATYRRFTTLATAASSVDATAAARLYATLKPRIEEAYRDLGHPDTSFDRALESAIVELLRTPIVDGPIAVNPGSKGIGLVFADPALESLTPPQKQLLRMGPDNMRTIQSALRSIALALGIPEGRLPGERHLRSS